jgi:hypothetical protein
VVLKLAPADQSALVTLDPQTFSPIPGAWGNKGWTNVQLQTAERAILQMALTSAWREVAPKRLRATAEQGR